MNRRSVVLIVAGVLAGCATAHSPPLTADNPASSSAPEVIEQPLRNALGVDDLTRKTCQIFAQGDKPQDQPSPQPKQTDQMSGVKMP
jgi:hypothetical protein